ncbi:MAG: hypothetical protein IAF02_19370, partial [Anaerolineae bacterium]|nr:hypothetical protein [Anaerolineae bacterium]
RLDYVLEARTGPGKFRITAVSGDARSSQEVDIAIEGEAQVSVITPTSTPSPSPTATDTATPTLTPTAIPSPTATPVPPPPEPQEPGINIALSEFATLIAVLVGLTMVVTAGYLLSIQSTNSSLPQQMRWVLWGVIGALVAYNYVALGLPGTAVLANLGAWGGLLITLIGGAAGLGLYTATHNKSS